MINVVRMDETCKFFGPTSDGFLYERHQTVTQLPHPIPRAIATPCIQVCVVDGASSLCLGCFRTLSEIGGWSGFSDDQRAKIMADLSQRRDRIDAGKLGPR